MIIQTHLCLILGVFSVCHNGCVKWNPSFILCRWMTCVKNSHILLTNITYFVGKSIRIAPNDMSNISIAPTSFYDSCLICWTLAYGVRMLDINVRGLSVMFIIINYCYIMTSFAGLNEEYSNSILHWKSFVLQGSGSIP